jgi:3-hydroxyacyl-CoA dehydrogenase
VPEILKVALGKSFYITPETGLEYIKFSGEYKKILREKGTRRFTEERRTKKSILSNKVASYFKVDNKVGMVEFHSKANALDGESMNLLSDAIDHAEENFRGLIIHNDSSHFSCGVNLECIAAFIQEKDWEGLDGFLDHFQKTMKKMKYSNIPVISAPAGLSIGGGFEVVLHTDRTVFHANSVTGLVESLVGVVPGGGGVKEMLYRWRDVKNNETEAAWATFMNIGYGKTAQSPMQGKELAMYRENLDTFVMNRDRLLDSAIDLTMQMLEEYSPTYRDNFIMPGREVWKEMQEWLAKTHQKGYLTPHDVTTGTQIAMIVTGGDIEAGTSMSEDDLFGLERRAFLKLARTDQTKSRINHMLSYGKPLRN